MAATDFTKGPVSVVVTGIPETRRALARLGNRGARAAARSAVGAGLKPVTKAIRRNAKTMVGKVTGRFGKSAGQRQKKNKRKGIYEAIAGLNVGKKAGPRDAPNPNYARHASIVALGTRVRTTKKTGANRGQMHGTPVVPTAYAQSKGESLSAMKNKLRERIEVETRKARRK